ncbi:MAG: COX15/CtaA family protein [Pacificimonas sp.]|jgi:cytochrome c oxidase assembly protein subunit 15|nr:COX15/CtaA family protein [Pacificimonas sp.]
MTNTPAIAATRAAVQPPTARPRAVATWLTVMAALVVVMVVVGGITRLTESGLSMVRWEPVMGIVPPLTEAGWQAEFEDYRTSPEYRYVNAGMSLAEYKNIYWWEWGHRLLGRLLGVAFAVPLIYFWVKKQIPAGYKPRLLVLFALGGFQGLLGWWMVKSGLADVPEVSHIRLALHLNTAFFIIALLVWTAQDLIRERARLTGFAALTAVILLSQFVMGAFVAGLKPESIWPEWPLMGGALFPEGVAMLEPAVRNLIDNGVVVQFVHRWWAFVAAGFAIWLGVKAMKLGSRRTPIALHALITVQILLGIMAVMTGVELWVGVAHQGTAALIVWAAAACAHRIGEPEAVAARVVRQPNQRTAGAAA